MVRTIPRYPTKPRALKSVRRSLFSSDQRTPGTALRLAQRGAKPVQWILFKELVGQSLCGVGDESPAAGRYGGVPFFDDELLASLAESDSPAR